MIAEDTTEDKNTIEDKNSIVYEIDCSNCEVVYFGESKRSLKWCSDEYKISARNCDCKKNEIAKYCLDQITTLARIRKSRKLYVL